MKINVSINDFDQIFFSQKSKYAVGFSVIKFDKKDYINESYSWIYGTEIGKLINVSEVDEKEIKKMSKRKYWY